MQGGGAYSANSRPQHVAAAVAYPYRRPRPTADPESTRPIRIGDLGCAGGANEMEPMARAVVVLRRHDSRRRRSRSSTPTPKNDFAPLFARLDDAESYTTGRAGLPAGRRADVVRAVVPGADAGARVIRDHVALAQRLPGDAPPHRSANLTTGDDRRPALGRNEAHWDVFLSRARAGSSPPRGRGRHRRRDLRRRRPVRRRGRSSRVIDETLATMVGDGALRPEERTRIFYPTWNRTPAEWLAPFDGPLGDAFDVVEHRVDTSRDDDVVYSQFRVRRRRRAFAAAYVGLRPCRHRAPVLPVAGR